MRPLLLLVLVATLAASSQAQNEWGSTAWVLDCPRTEHNGDTVDLAACCQQVGLEEWQCDMNNAGSPAAAVVAQLEEATPWLQGLGFRAPEATRDGRPPRQQPYPYQFTLGGAEVLVENDLVNGYYDNSEPGGTIVVDATHYFQLGDGSNDTATPVHELFHAIQASYSFYDYRSNRWKWVVEGTAAAVEWQWLQREGEGGWGYGFPWYDYPLHRPKDYSDRNSLQPYARGHFWSRLGLVLDSPDQIGYLHELFANMGDNADDLEAVEAGLQSIEPKGLYEIYPRFVARYANHPTYVEHSTETTLSLNGSREYTDANETVKPVAIRHYTVYVDVPEGDVAGLEIRLAEDDPDLHLIVDTNRYDVAPLEGEGFVRNVARQAIVGGQRDTLYVRVANVAEAIADTEDQTYTLEMTLEPVEQCSRDAMTAALNEDNVIGGSYALNPDVLIADSLLLPSEGTLAIGGLVSDEGIACTHHLAALDFLGAAMTGTMEMDEASREALEARAERLSEQAAAMDLENMTEEDAENMTPAQRRRMMAMVNDAMQVTRPVSEDQEDVVLNLYSPHLTTWQFGMLSIPWATKHTGLGGWAANAAANLVIQLPGTNPSDLQEGETYAAVASAPTSDPDGTQEALSTMIGFYTRWTGTFQDVPYPLPSTPSEAQRQAESRAACEQVKLQYAHLLATTGAVDVLLNPHPWQSLDCHNKGLAFQGTTEVVSGELSGTVTIEAITGAEVTGRFNLDGIGTLETETTTFTYEEGLLTGSDGETTQRNGPVTMRGTFSAPYRIAGIPRMIGYRTVIIE